MSDQYADGAPRRNTLIGATIAIFVIGAAVDYWLKPSGLLAAVIASVMLAALVTIAAQFAWLVTGGAHLDE